MLFFQKLVLRSLDCIEEWLEPLEALLKALQNFIWLNLSHENCYFLSQQLKVSLALLKVHQSYQLPHTFLSELSPFALLHIKTFNVFEVVFIVINVLELCYLVPQLLLVSPQFIFLAYNQA